MLAMQATDEIKKMAALDAKLRRICNPKPLSGKLEVNPEIHKQWAAGGQQRKVLLQVLIKANGDKAGFTSILSSKPHFLLLLG